MATRAVVVAIVENNSSLPPDQDSVRNRGSAHILPPDVVDFPALTNWLRSKLPIPDGSGHLVMGKLVDSLPEMWLPFEGALPDGHLFVKIVLPPNNPAPLTHILAKLDAIQGEVSSTRSASRINGDDFSALCQVLRIIGPISEDKDGKPLRDDDDVFKLLLGDEKHWDDRYEEQQREENCRKVESWWSSRKTRWVNGNSETIRRRFEGLHFAVSSKNDLVAVLRRFRQHIGQGAVLGVELKRKRLTMRALRQAIVEFLLWGDASVVPFVQLVTDMEKGGIALYCIGMDDETGVELRQVVLVNMEEVREFVSKLGASLPDDLGDDGAQGRLILPQALDFPPRKKFRQLERPPASATQGTAAGLERATPAQIALWTLGPRFLENDGDVANLADLADFDVVAAY